MLCQYHFNNEDFNDDYMNNKTTFKCAFCKFENVFSTTINNYNTNDKLIKILIYKMNTMILMMMMMMMMI